MRSTAVRSGGEPAEGPAELLGQAAEPNAVAARAAHGSAPSSAGMVAAALVPVGMVARVTARFAVCRGAAADHRRAAATSGAGGAASDMAAAAPAARPAVPRPGAALGVATAAAAHPTAVCDSAGVVQNAASS